MNAEFKVVDLNTNEGNRSAVIKYKSYRFLLKPITKDAYGSDRVANLFVMLPNGDKAFVQTICALKKISQRDGELENFLESNDCFIHELLPFEKAIEHSINFISILYGE
jgi:hypothetical protein